MALTIVALPPTVPCTSTLTWWPVARFPTGHVTVVDETLHVTPPSALALTPLRPAGSVLVSTTPLASEGPVLTASISTCWVWPATGPAGLSTAVTDRSAEVTVTTALSALLVVSGSSCAPPTLAWLTVAEPAAVAVARATTCTAAVAPLARSPIGQLSVVPDCMQPASSETYSRPASSVLLTATPLASDGPPLRAVSAKVTCSPTSIVLASATALIDRSAWRVAPPLSVALLLVRLASPPPDTMAVLSTEAPL